MDIDFLLKETVRLNGSDLHITAGYEPIVRVDGELSALYEEAISDAKVEEMIEKLLSQSQYEYFKEGHEVDLSYSIKGTGFFRINVYQTYTGPAIALRILPNEIPNFKALGFSDIHRRLCEMPNGLILVTGPTGSGKSTTLASMINYINKNTHQHIITIEDPIEYRYENQQCMIHQREAGLHTLGFSEALRSALRQDPDIILVGELRDLETIRLALTAAETGQLVFGTLHTRSAPQTVSRIIDVFPSGEKHLVQIMLSNTLQGVIGQTLLKRKVGGRIAAQEIMLGTSAIRNLIRENKIAQMRSAIQTGRDYGMQTLEQHKKQLATTGVISQDQVGSEDEGDINT